MEPNLKRSINSFSRFNCPIIEDSSHEYEKVCCLEYEGNIVSEKALSLKMASAISGLDVGPKPRPYEAVHNFIKDNDNFAFRSTQVGGRTESRFLKRIK